MNYDELEDAWIDWSFGSNTIYDLEQQGYKWLYVGKDIPDDLDIGEYALVVDDFPLGDVLVAKKLIDPRLVHEMGLVPVGWDTRNQVKVERILAFFGDGDIEVSHPRYKWAALVHPATRKGVEWQGSQFGEHGPFTHVEGRTRREVVKKLVKEGYTEPDPGAVERIFRYRGNPPRSIESFLR